MAVALIFLIFTAVFYSALKGRASLRHQDEVSHGFLDHSHGVAHLLEGLYTTIWLVAASLMLGLMLAVPMGILRNSRNWLIKGPIWALYLLLLWHPAAGAALPSSTTAPPSGSG